ncbi:unannotated protein [freshwater metagenome]|uniref:Unannotated protein n=1 Tax=freshwater metagenome TaxID=449393 RepID=A0A6J7B243_9ZZZZ
MYAGLTKRTDGNPAAEVLGTIAVKPNTAIAIAVLALAIFENRAFIFSLST